MHPLVELAKRAIEAYVRQGKVIPPPKDLTPEMQGRAGTFVSLHDKSGNLRGCIGTIERPSRILLWKSSTMLSARPRGTRASLP